MARPQKLSSLHRLTKTDEFSSVFRFRCQENGPFLRVLGRPNGTTLSRLGMVVRKKVASRSVGRNYMRRVIRETFRHHLGELEGLDVVVQVQQPFDRESRKMAVDELLQHFVAIVKCRNS